MCKVYFVVRAETRPGHCSRCSQWGGRREHDAGSGLRSDPARVAAASRAVPGAARLRGRLPPRLYQPAGARPEQPVAVGTPTPRGPAGRDGRGDRPARRSADARSPTASARYRRELTAILEALSLSLDFGEEADRPLRAAGRDALGIPYAGLRVSLQEPHVGR